MNRGPCRSLVFWMILAFLAGCSQPEIRETDDSKRIQQVDQFLKGLEGLIGARDTSSLRNAYPPERMREIEGLDRVVRLIEAPRMELFLDWILMDGDQVEVALHWEYRWNRSDEDGVSVRRGNATFQLDGVDVLRIRSIRGDNPFLAPLTGEVLPP
jgi:hypothetical protein